MTYYDEISEGYEELHKEEQLKKLAIIKKELGEINKKTKLLDVGCGTGVTTQFDCDNYGIDPAPKLIEKAKQKKGKYLVAAAEDIPFPDNFFDIVVSVTAIQNFADVEKGVKEIKRVGKNIFVISCLKKSPKLEKIKKIVGNIFKIKKEIEEEKDIIWFLQKD